MNKQTPIQLRFATMDDLALLQYWDTQPHVILSDPNEDDYWDWEDDLQHTHDWQQQYIAELNGRPLGFLQILDPARDESEYWGQVAENVRAIDIWIGEASDLNKGYGTEMMRQAIERCFQDPDVVAILLDPLISNTNAQRFYERLGFKKIEQRRFGNDDCFVYRLDRSDWQATSTMEASVQRSSKNT